MNGWIDGWTQRIIIIIIIIIIEMNWGKWEVKRTRTRICQWRVLGAGVRESERESERQIRWK